MNRKVLAGLGVVTSFAWSGAQPCVLAQPPEANIEVAAVKAPAEAEEVRPFAPELRVLPLKNIPSSFVAWMLDPKHNPEPFSFALSRKTLEQLGRVADIKTPKEILPVGVESVVSAQEQNALLAVGTP